MYPICSSCVCALMAHTCSRERRDMPLLQSHHQPLLLHIPAHASRCTATQSSYVLTCLDHRGQDGVDLLLLQVVLVKSTELLARVAQRLQGRLAIRGSLSVPVSHQLDIASAP